MFQKVKPFVKWAGGKTQLLEEIRKHYPSQIEKYCEPFVGGGAVLFDVLQKVKPQKVLINDINPNLINTYEQVKSNVDRLCEKLNQFQNQYLSKSDDERKSFFYEMRGRFNKIKLNDAVIEPVKITCGDYKNCADFCDDLGVPAISCRRAIRGSAVASFLRFTLFRFGMLRTATIPNAFAINSR